MVMYPFFGDPEILAKYRTRMEAHIAADELVQRIGFESLGDVTMGCFVGCTLDRYEYSGFPDELNMPIQVASLCDAIHEGLPKDRIADFASRFFTDVSLASDASLWWPKFAVRLLTDPTHGVCQYAENPSIIDVVSRLYQCVVAGELPSQEEWDAARNVEWNAEWNAEWAAVWAIAGDTARTAVRAFAGAAARAAAWTAEVSAAEDAHYVWQAETLLEIISE